VKIDAIGCVAVMDTCANTTATMINCTSSAQGLCIPSPASACTPASSNAINVGSCSTYTGRNLTFS
jgi:hypothetical protein